LFIRQQGGAVFTAGTQDHRKHIAPVGTDPGKTTFHLVALPDRGTIIIKKKFSRKS
jgi:hypothetical protein